MVSLLKPSQSAVIHISIRLGSYGGEDSPLDISRVRTVTSGQKDSHSDPIQGMYAGEVGVPRLLKLFDKYKIKTTWFIPGLSQTVDAWQNAC